MKLLRLIILLILFSSCNNPKDDKGAIVIQGNVTGVPDGVLFLAAAGKWRTAIDSAECKDGKFVFRLKTDSTFYPYPAAIYYWKKEDPAKPVRLQFRNHRLPDSLQTLRDIFYLEKGEIIITGRQGTAPHLRIAAGKETELLFNYQHIDIGWMGYKDTAERKSRLQLLRQAIKENPGSYFLLQSIYDAKELYSKNELVELKDLFHRALVNSAYGRRFSDYLQIRPDDGVPISNLSFLSSEGKIVPLVDTAAQLNILVFWASWCGPCIKEIPQLNAIYKKYKSSAVSMKSISIDTDKAAWENAILLHRMSWPQLFIGKNDIERVQHIFSFTTIPFMVITDGRGVEIKRFADYDESGEEKIGAAIESALYNK